MRHLFIALSLIYSSLSYSQDLKSYQIYNAAGETVTFGAMAEDLKQAEVVLFGELHNNPICHWLQHELTMALYDSNRTLVLGAEMFEADNQEVLNQYLEDSIDAKALDTLARLWPNYKTDYAMLVNFAKSKNLDFIATNIPRRFASQVFRQGLESLDSLSDSLKNWIAPLPIPYDAELPGYKAMLEMMGGHGGENLPKAQAIKDATMAHFIVLNLPKEGQFIHYNGDYHSKDFEGINWYINQYRKGLSIKTISTQIQEHVFPADSSSLGHADYTIIVDGEVTTSY